jgi:hypothetical protein
LDEDDENISDEELEQIDQAMTDCIDYVNAEFDPDKRYEEKRYGWRPLNSESCGSDLNRNGLRPIVQ